MRRVEELLRDLCQASKAIGNTELENKFAEGTHCSLHCTRMSLVMCCCQGLPRSNEILCLQPACISDSIISLLASGRDLDLVV